MNRNSKEIMLRRNVKNSYIKKGKIAVFCGKNLSYMQGIPLNLAVLMVWKKGILNRRVELETYFAEK